MNIKEKIMQEGMKLMSNPKVMKLMQDERVMKTVMAAMSMPAKISSMKDTAGEKLAKTMHMATEQEVNDLKRTIRKLEEEVELLKKSN